MIKKFDDWLLSLHQWVVNTTQRTPGWFVRQSAILLVLVTVGVAIVSKSSTSLIIVGVAVTLLYSGVTIALSYSEAATSAFGAGWKIRVTLAIASYISSLLLILITLSNNVKLVDQLLFLFRDIVFLATMYFAGCKPPPPPKRREQFTLQGNES